MSNTLKSFLVNNSFASAIVKMVMKITIIYILSLGVMVYLYYSLGIEMLFNNTISQALDESVKVAQLYLNEHKEGIKADIMAVANDIENNQHIFVLDDQELMDFLDQEEQIRNLSEIMIFTNSKIIAHSTLSFPLLFENFSSEILRKADKGEIVILDSSSKDKVRAIIKLVTNDHLYVMVGRYIDQKILHYLDSTQGSVNKYYELSNRINLTKYKLTIIFLILSTIICIVAILISTKIAKKIIIPIHSLAVTTMRIAAGDLKARVKIKNRAHNEITMLAQAFNNMTKRIERQTNDLKNANSMLEERKSFIEMVLKEVSSGLVVLNEQLKITLFNDIFCKLLEVKNARLYDTKYDVILPELSDLITKSHEDNAEIVEGNLLIHRNQNILHLFVRIGVTKNKDKKSYIITIDDMTNMVRAQKQAAWRDVARRIAHEIKNPLTPIQLASEQIKKKSPDNPIILRYVKTIINYVEDIGKIVEDFVKFANIAPPVLQANNIGVILDEMIFSFQNVYPSIEYNLNLLPEKYYALCDKTQISQAIINLLKNAAESIEARLQTSDQQPGIINIKCEISDDNEHIRISITDNGLGLTLTGNDLFEPYVTTKKRGTGLGLAITKKIIEEHGGILTISNVKNGACASFLLSKLDILTPQELRL